MASFVGLWAGMNYEQLTSLFRVEERSVAFVSASLTNIFLTIGATLLLVVALDKGPIGVIVGNFTGTLLVYVVLVGYRREQLGLQFDRGLLREMNRFGIPLVPTALFLWVTNFSDRLFLVKLADTPGGRPLLGRRPHRVGDRIAPDSVPPRVAGVRVLDRRRPRGTANVRVRPHVPRRRHHLGRDDPRAPLAVDRPVDRGTRVRESSRVVGPLAFSTVAFAGYIVVAIGVGRAKRTQFNWVVTGAAAVVNIGLNLLLIPPYGMMGAAIATIAAYTTMFVGMAWWSQRIYPVAYQWRRVVTAAATGVALVAIGKLAGGGLPVAVALALLYPLALLPLGFYLPAERRAIGSRLRLAR